MMLITELDALGLITIGDEAAVVIFKITAKGKAVAAWVRGASKGRGAPQVLSRETAVAKLSWVLTPHGRL